MIDRKRLGKIVRKTWNEWAEAQEAESGENAASPTIPALDEQFQELDCLIGEAVQKAVLAEFESYVVWFKGEGEREAIDGSELQKLIKFTESELKQENVNFSNLISSLFWGIRQVKGNERDIASRFLAFKDDTLSYLRALVIIVEMTNGDQTHAVKRVLLNHLIKQLEGAIAKIRQVENYLLTDYWNRSDVFKSDYPVRYWREKVAELEAQIKNLKDGKPSGDGIPF